MVTPLINGWAMSPEQQKVLLRIATGELDFLFPEAVALTRPDWVSWETTPTPPLPPPPPPPPAPLLTPSPSPSTPRKRAAEFTFIDGSPGKKQKTTPTESSRGVPSTPSTPSSGVTFIACTPASSPRTTRKRVPTRTAAIPKSWAEASLEDHMLFELKNAGGSWQQIANAWNDLFRETFTPKSLSSRWQRVKAKIGLPPPEEPTGDEETNE